MESHSNSTLIPFDNKFETLNNSIINVRKPPHKLYVSNHNNSFKVTQKPSNAAYTKYKIITAARHPSNESNLF